MNNSLKSGRDEPIPNNYYDFIISLIKASIRATGAPSVVLALYKHSHTAYFLLTVFLTG